MTTFTLAAEYHGRRVKVGWHNGRLFGDWSAVGAIASLAVSLEGQPVISAGKVVRVTWNDHLTDPRSAHTLMIMVLGKDAQLVAGELPTEPTPGVAS